MFSQMGVPARPQKAAINTPVHEVPTLLSPRSFFVLALFLLALLFAVYSPSLGFQFILDDHRFTGDPRIQWADHVWEYFTNFVWAQFTGGPPSFYRPLFLVWLRFNFILSAMSPWGWHFLSIAKHAAVAVLLGFLVWQLLRDRAAVLIAATLFALHPAQTESVSWVTVPDPLMSLCVLGTLLLYLRWVSMRFGTQSDGKRAAKAVRTKKTNQPSAFWLTASALSFFAALLAKETAIVLPGVIFAVALLTSRSERESAGLTPWLLRAFRQTLPYFCVTLVYLLMRLNALGGTLASRTQHLPWSTVLLSWPATLWFYLKVLFWPVRSRAFADPTLVNQLSFRGVLLPSLGVGCFIAMLAGVLFWAWRKARRDLSSQAAGNVECALLISTLLLVLPILLTLDLNALNPGDFLHGRYAYLPLAGLMLLVATAWHLTGKMRVPLLCVASLIALAFAALVVVQEKQWKDDLTVFTMAHQLAPRNVPVAVNLANAQVQIALSEADDGQCSEAMPVFEITIRNYPENSYAWAGLAECFVQLNNLPRAEESLHRAVELSHDPRLTQEWRKLRAQMGLPTVSPSN
jgi:protein O-mannosyl-transferase